MRVTLVIRNVDKDLLLKQVRELYDLAHKERTKGRTDQDTERLANAANLDALLDMLQDAEIIKED